MPEPIRIGWLGAALDGPGGGYDKIHRMAFDEAVESGLLDRPYEFVLHAENGLPNGSAKNATDGFKYLVDGEEVEFEVQEDSRGPKAVNVVRLNPPPEKPRGKYEA